MKIKKPTETTTLNNSSINESKKKTWTKKRIITYIGVSSFVILALIFFLTPTNKSTFLKRLENRVKTEQLTTDYEVTVKGTDATQSSTGVVLEKVNISGVLSKDHDNTHITVTTKGLEGLPFEVPYLDLVSYEKENYINVNSSIEYIARVASLYGFDKVDHEKYNDYYVNIETLIRTLAGEETAKSYKSALDPSQNKEVDIQSKINSKIGEFLKSRKSDQYSKGRDNDVILSLEENDIKELIMTVLKVISDNEVYSKDLLESWDKVLNSETFTNQHITARITMGENIGDMNVRVLFNGEQTGEVMINFKSKTFEPVEKPTKIMDQDTFNKAIQDLQNQILETNLKTNTTTNKDAA